MKLKKNQQKEQKKKIKHKQNRVSLLNLIN